MAKGYNPNQPRVPAGSDAGGEWAGVHSGNYTPLPGQGSGGSLAGKYPRGSAAWKAAQSTGDKTSDEAIQNKLLLSRPQSGDAEEQYARSTERVAAFHRDQADRFKRAAAAHKPNSVMGRYFQKRANKHITSAQRKEMKI